MFSWLLFPTVKPQRCVRLNTTFGCRGRASVSTGITRPSVRCSLVARVRSGWAAVVYTRMEHLNQMKTWYFNIFWTIITLYFHTHRIRMSGIYGSTFTIKKNQMLASIYHTWIRHGTSKSDENLVISFTIWFHQDVAFTKKHEDLHGVIDYSWIKLGWLGFLVHISK